MCSSCCFHKIWQVFPWNQFSAKLYVFTWNRFGCVQLHSVEKYNKTRSLILRKDQYFFCQINVFTKELISRKFLPFFLGYNSAEHNLLYFQICITFTWFQFITIFSHFFEMFLFSFTYFLMSRWPLLYFCLLAAQQYSVYWRNLLSLSEKYDDASDIRRRADF